MAELFLTLSAEERREALGVAAAQTARPAHLLEKDVWVVWTLQTLFEAAYGRDLVFKGGTSLSKAYGVIRRFSEDVDLTYDIRALAPDLKGDGDEPLPPTRSQEKKWTKEIRERLPAWVADQVVPSIEQRLADQKLSARVSLEADKLFIAYEAVTAASAYVRPAVLLEFGARSTGEPSELKAIACDAASTLPGLLFPTATPRVMRAERTFWEKATAMHVYCAQGQFRGGERFARHWYDVARLHDAGIAASAIADRKLAEAVARHKSAFFAEKDAAGNQIDYHAAVSGGLHLVPVDEARVSLAQDYQRMVDEGLLLDAPESFDTLVHQIQTIQDLVNSQPK